MKKKIKIWANSNYFIKTSLKLNSVRTSFDEYSQIRLLEWFIDFAADVPKLEITYMKNHESKYTLELATGKAGFMTKCEKLENTFSDGCYS